MNQYEFTLRTRNLEAFLGNTIMEINKKLDTAASEFDKQDLSGCADLCRGSRIRVDGVIETLQTFVKENEKEMKASKLKDLYDDYVFANKQKLEDEFLADNDFRTTVRGLKVRGVYGSRQEAELRSKKLQRNDQIHNIFLGEVGKWLPWDPEPTDVTEQEYAEEQLNTLMKKYKENEEAREMFMKENRMRGTAKGAVTMKREDDNINSMFSGPADLALERKMEKKE